MTDKRKSVIIADDETHIRYILKNLVQKEGMVVIGEAADGQTALEMFRKHQPDVLLIDINMPVKTGDKVLEEVMKEFPAAKVIMLTMVADSVTVQRCIEAGAANYILKSSETSEIRRIIHETCGM